MSDLSSIVPGITGLSGGAGGYGPAAPISRNGAVAPIGPADTTPALEPNNRLSSLTSGEDRVEVSDFARYLEHLRRLPEVRLDRVAAARQAISEGRYDDEALFEAALDRMTEEEGL